MKIIPLHLLPDEAYLSVLRNMEICVQLAYSLCSKNTKKAIKSLNLKADLIKLNVENYIHIEINFANSIQFASYIRRDNHFFNNHIIARKEVYKGSPYGNQVQWSWNFKNLEFKGWVHHFCEVLHYLRIDELVFSGRSIDDNDIEPVQKVIKGLQIGSLALCGDLTNDFVKKALEVFPNYEKLALFQVPFDNQKLNKLLVQNLTSLCIGEAGEIKIDQLLLTNSKRIYMHSSRFNEKDLNRLLKLWIRGTNPRLMYFCIERQLQPGNNSLDENIVLKGFEYSQVPLDSEEVYRDYYREIFYNEINLAGGYRIRRFDGTTAVIVVENNMFKFIVE